jgi:hypothetical protein
MIKKDIIFGLFIGLILACLGTFITTYLLLHKNIFTDYQIVKQLEVLGKLITLGSLLNVVAFLILLKKGKDEMAKGILVSIIFLMLYTLIS